MTNEATEKNLARKSHWADKVQLLPDGTPLFSWCDLNITELCNRSAGAPNACSFCPRIDAGFYPNQNLHMSIDLARRLGDELRWLDYEGAVILCGFGEPLLHPRLNELVGCFNGLRVELVTNGDRLDADKIDELYAAGVSYMLVSMYDGPHQVQKFTNMFFEAARSVECYGLRDRWHSEANDFGLKLTNRAGTIDAGNQPDVNPEARCFYPSYSMAVDWNGDVLLCVQDWNKRLRFGNLSDMTLVDAWTSKALHKRRVQLLTQGRKQSPCSECNADGTCHGRDHARIWLDK